jgi:hypothetical protein
MYKFKNSLVAFGGLSLLIGAIAFVTPRSTQGQGGDPVGPTKPVEVVNTPTVNAQQSGAWNVGITGTPTIRIDPNSNGVTVAPRRTTLLLNTGIYDPSVGGFPTQGPIAVGQYSKIRILAENFSDSAGDILIRPRVTLTGGVSFFLEEEAFVRLEPGEKFSRVYEVPGETLHIDVAGNSLSLRASVAVFGN